MNWPPAHTGSRPSSTTIEPHAAHSARDVWNCPGMFRSPRSPCVISSSGYQSHGPNTRVGAGGCATHARRIESVWWHFLKRENRHLPFGFCGEFERRLACWDGLSITDFVYAIEGDEIMSCVAPWSPSQVKQTVVSRVPPALRLLGLAASLFPHPPLRIPGAGEPLRSPYLTHLTFSRRLTEAERASVFRAMLDDLFDCWRDADWHCVALCDFRIGVWGGFCAGLSSRRFRSLFTPWCHPGNRPTKRMPCAAMGHQPSRWQWFS